MRVLHQQAPAPPPPVPAEVPDPQLPHAEEGDGSFFQRIANAVKSGAIIPFTRKRIFPSYLSAFASRGRWRKSLSSFQTGTRVAETQKKTKNNWKSQSRRWPQSWVGKMATSMDPKGRSMLFGTAVSTTLKKQASTRKEFVCLELAVKKKGPVVEWALENGPEPDLTTTVDLGNGGTVLNDLPRYPSYVARGNQIVSVEEPDMYWKWKATLLVMKRIQSGIVGKYKMIVKNRDLLSGTYTYTPFILVCWEAVHTGTQASSTARYRNDLVLVVVVAVFVSHPGSKRRRRLTPPNSKSKSPQLKNLPQAAQLLIEAGELSFLGCQLVCCFH